MTATNENFTVTNGDDYTIVFRNYDENGNKLSLVNYTMKWSILFTTPLIKTTPIVNNNELTFTLDAIDTKGLPGSFNHVLEVFDYNNKKTTLSKGVVTIV